MKKVPIVACRLGLVVGLIMLLHFAVGQEDRFFFEHQSDWDNDIMSPSDWEKVECDDLATCVSYSFVC